MLLAPASVLCTIAISDEGCGHGGHGGELDRGGRRSTGAVRSDERGVGGMCRGHGRLRRDGLSTFPCSAEHETDGSDDS